MRKRRRKKKSFLKRFIMILLSLAVIVFGGYIVSENVDIEITLNNDTVIDLDSIPDYDEDPYIEINDNIPYFTDDEITTEVFEEYSELDDLGRCGVAYANICQELMPTEKRQSIGMIKPTGWQIAKYDFIVGQYLYNRCHLIGFQLAGENANEKNLITGTRYMNVDGMLPFENMIADYVKETDNHVLYRVTPLFDGDYLIASGVEMEAYSVEDDGEGICFHVYVYNVQPGVVIDYATGDNELEE
ncbi:MAG: DNA/RNA non-specific endonuclease [Erysipelotrichaceae bacterium]|nr:DNA/RNA non-specific endonuclease [Erysipelotrichaceae bacterium]